MRTDNTSARVAEVARPPVAASAGTLTLAGAPAYALLSRFTRFWMFSAIHGDEWLFHDYDAVAGLLMLAQMPSH